MNVDNHNTFSDAQALTETTVSTNLVDLSAARAIGEGNPLAVMITVDVAADAGNNNETYQFTVQTDDNSSFSSPMNLTTILYGALPSIPRAHLAAGSVIVLPLPVLSETTGERYVRVSYTLGGTTPSVTVTAELQPMNMVQAYRSYAKGFTISG